MRIFAALILISALGACSKKPEPPPPVPGATPVGMLPPAPDLEARADGPSISLSANGSTHPTLFKGWELNVAAHAEPASLAAAPALEVLDASGAAVAWPFEKAAGAGRDFTWSLPAERTAALAPGVYRMKAGADSLEIDVTVAEAPAVLTEPQQRSLFLNRTAALLSSGKAEQAAALAREEQTRAPKDPNPWVVEGDALQRLGRPADAAARYRQALRLFRLAHPKSPEPPSILLLKLASAESPPSEK